MDSIKPQYGENPEIANATEDYIRLLSRSRRKWSLEAKEDLSDNYSKAKLMVNLATLGTPFEVEDIEREFGIQKLDGRDSMIQLGRILMQSLSQDVADCLDAGELNTLSLCNIRMIDIGQTNALCSNRDIGGDPIPGYVVLANQGLYFCIKLLITAQIYEDMQGDFASYRKSGAEVFAAACHLMVTESPELLNIGSVYTGNEEIDGAIEAHVSLGTIILMQFVVLHELGHAHLGHTELVEQGHLLALSAVGDDDIEVNEEELAVHHDAEFEADAFAWNALARRANDPMKNLGNFYCIRLFFRFLETIEHKTDGPWCKYHPSPSARIDRLVALYAPNGLTEFAQQQFDRQDQLIETWSKFVNIKER